MHKDNQHVLVQLPTVSFASVATFPLPVVHDPVNENPSCLDCSARKRTLQSQFRGLLLKFLQL